MYRNFDDRTNISFGKLSDPRVVRSSPLSREDPVFEYFTSANFQYVVDNVADMFGISHGTIKTAVVENDHILGWLDRNNNRLIEDDEISMNFIMNAGINTYTRNSKYGKYFMYQQAKEYGYPIIFGIVAHEVGHLVNCYTMNSVDNRIVEGVPCLVEVQKLNDRWDELCADYLSGVVLAQASPRLSHEPIKNFLSGTVADEAHPDGFWRVYAVEMGYQWGCSNSPMLASRILTDKTQLQQLLVSFFQGYYQQIYCGVNASVRNRYSTLSQYMLENCFNVLGRI